MPQQYDSLAKLRALQAGLQAKANVFDQRDMVGYGVGASDQFLKPEDVNAPWFPPTLSGEGGAVGRNMGVPFNQITPEELQMLLAMRPALAEKLGGLAPPAPISNPSGTVNLFDLAGKPELGRPMEHLAAQRLRRQRPNPQQLAQSNPAMQELLRQVGGL